MVRIDPSWHAALQQEFGKPYFARLTAAVRAEYAAGPCYPPGPLIFRAFDACPFDAVKAVIIGQDPYHEPGQAMGLSFSVPEGTALPPSLQNIYKEIAGDLGAAGGAVATRRCGDLTRWATQGVLLLNATLTVRAHIANSHAALGWGEFTDAAIAALSRSREHVVFMLWGGFARSKRRLIDPARHLILEAAHPSPLSANRGGWFGCRHFSQCNAYLAQHGVEPIQW